MDYKEYPEIATKTFAELKQKAGETKDGYFKMSLITTSCCQFVEYVTERNDLLTGGPASMYYKEGLKFTLGQSGKLLEYLASVFPDNHDIEYLRTAYKVISYKTTINTEKTTKKSELHPAFFPFIDMVETLRRTAFLTMSTAWAEGNHFYFNSEWGKKFKDKSIVSMKLIQIPFYAQMVLKDREAFLKNYENFKKQYFKGVETVKKSTVKALNEMDGLEDREKILQSIEEPVQRVKEEFPPDAEALAEGIDFFAVQIREKLKKLYMYCDRDFTTFAPAFQNLQPTFNYNKERQEAYLKSLDNLKQQRDKNIVSILQELEEPGEETKEVFAVLSFFYQSLKEIIPPDKARLDLEAITTAVRTNFKKTDKINYPLDKVSNNLWKDVEKSENGQISFSTVKKGKRKELTVLTAINFPDEIEGAKISKKLTQFDKRICVAYSSIFNAGNQLMTLTQIHYAMGNTKRPSERQLKKIDDSITKMATAWFFLDNAIEVDKLKYNYPKFKYDGPFLPMERTTAVINGKLSDAVIHAFREPPLITFAKERKQITTFNIKLLQSEISKTDNNLAIEDYLIERIAETKNASGKSKKLVINTILIETLCQEVGIKTRMQKTRAIKSIKIYLDHFKKNNFISNYKVDAEKISFWFKKQINDPFTKDKPKDNV